jgi:hypothetical protein
MAPAACAWDDDERSINTGFNPWKRMHSSVVQGVSEPLIDIKRCIVVNPYEYMFVDSETDDEDPSVILDCNYCAKSSTWSNPSDDADSDASDASDASDSRDACVTTLEDGQAKEEVTDSTVHITPFFYT